MDIYLPSMLTKNVVRVMFRNPFINVRKSQATIFARQNGVGDQRSIGIRRLLTRMTWLPPWNDLMWPGRPCACWTHIKIVVFFKLCPNTLNLELELR